MLSASRIIFFFYVENMHGISWESPNYQITHAVLFYAWRRQTIFCRRWPATQQDPYSDVTRIQWRLNSPAYRQFVQQRVWAIWLESLMRFDSVPLSPPHWSYLKRVWPQSWPRVESRHWSQHQLFTWRAWSGVSAVPKCDQRSAASGEPIRQNTFILRRITIPVLNWWLQPMIMNCWKFDRLKKRDLSGKIYKFMILLVTVIFITAALSK